MIRSVSSRAADRPTLGSAPAPRPFVNLLPICSLTGALFARSAWRSVFATMSSTPSSPEPAIRLTALPPPPPTPITLIRAVAAPSSSRRSRRRCSLNVASALFRKSDIEVAPSVLSRLLPCAVRRFLRPAGYALLATAYAPGLHPHAPPRCPRQKNSLNSPRNRPATRPNAPAPTGTRPESVAKFRCAYSTRPTPVAKVGLLTWSASPPTPDGQPRRIGKSKICSAISGIPSRIGPPPVSVMPQLRLFS